MSKLLGAPPEDEFYERFPMGTIRRSLAFALVRRLGHWVSTAELIEVAYSNRDGPAGDAVAALKAHIHLLRDELPPGYVLDGDKWWGRRLRKIDT